MFENSLIVVNIKLDNARWFLRGLNKPFDPFAQKAMHDTMIGIANCTEAAFLVDIFCYNEMLRVTYLYYERLRKQSKSKTKIEMK